jgi:hypothetical protein
VGQFESSATETKTQALETVTAETLAKIELEDSAGSKVLKLTAVEKGVKGNTIRVNVIENAAGTESEVTVSNATEQLETTGLKAKASEIKTYFEAHTTNVTVSGAGSANKLKGYLKRTLVIKDSASSEAYTVKPAGEVPVKINVTENAAKSKSYIWLTTEGGEFLEAWPEFAKSSEVSTYAAAHTRYITLEGAGTTEKLKGLASTSVNLGPQLLSGGVNGKTFYITDMYFATSHKETEILDLKVEAGGTDIFRAGVHTLSAVEMAGIETQPFATEGQVVQIKVPKMTGAQKVWFNVWGFEQ